MTGWVSATLEFWHKEWLLRLQTLQKLGQSDKLKKKTEKVGEKFKKKILKKLETNWKVEKEKNEKKWKKLKKSEKNWKKVEWK